MDARCKPKNIILDFMDPENRILYGTYANYNSIDHEMVLGQALNVAVLFCDEYCILPPCAIMQCKIARNILINKSSYFNSGLIKFPVRERTLKAFFEKKKLNYEKDKLDNDYSEFFLEDGPKFLIEHATEIIKRETKVGEAVAEMVASLNYDDPLLAGLKKMYDNKTVELIKLAPTQLIRNDEAISVKAIKRIINLNCDEDADFQIGRILQNKYFYIYIYEYNAQIIYDIPPKTTDFLMNHDDIAFEFSYIRHVLNLIGIYDVILNTKSDNIINIRKLSSYYEFIKAFIEIARNSNTIDKAKKKASLIAEVCESDMKKPFERITYNEKAAPEDLDKVINVISDRFSVFAEAYQKYRTTIKNNDVETSSFGIQSSRNSEDILKLKMQLSMCDLNRPYMFIGYNRYDCEQQVYEDCICLGKMGINYWIDNANMHGCNANSDGWKTVINEAIKNCSIYIPYISPSFFDSTACCEEVRNFFNLNSEASIILLIQNGFTMDAIIRKILTYDNILQGDDAQNMIKLFKASPNNDGSGQKYSIDQLYRIFQKPYFKHYIEDSIFYNTFVKRNLISTDVYSNFESWRIKGEYFVKN